MCFNNRVFHAHQEGLSKREEGRRGRREVGQRKREEGRRGRREVGQRKRERGRDREVLGEEDGERPRRGRERKREKD